MFLNNNQNNKYFITILRATNYLYIYVYMNVLNIHINIDNIEENIYSARSPKMLIQLRLRHISPKLRTLYMQKVHGAYYQL